jgi:hypothetical protein
VSRLPIRWKVTLAFTGALAVVLVGAGAFLYLRMAAELEQATDRGLRARADEVAGLIDRAAPALPRPTTAGLEADESITHVLRGDGAVLAASSYGPVRLLRDDQLSAALGGAVVVERPGDAALDESLRILAMPVPRGDETVVVAVATSSDERTEALSALLVLEVAICPYTSWLSVAMVRTASRPCRTPNSSSRNCSGLPMCPPVTCRSRFHTSSVSAVRWSRSRPISALTRAPDSSQARLGRNRPLSNWRAIAPVST